MRSSLHKAGVQSPFSRDALEDAGSRHGAGPFAVIGSNTMDLEVGRSGMERGCGAWACASASCSAVVDGAFTAAALPHGVPEQQPEGRAELRLPAQPAVPAPLAVHAGSSACRARPLAAGSGRCASIPGVRWRPC